MFSLVSNTDNLNGKPFQAVTVWSVTYWCYMPNLQPWVRAGPTWTCVPGARRRCRPKGDDTDPALASSDPGSVLKRQDLLLWILIRPLMSFLASRTDKSHAATQDEDAVQGANFHKFVCFIPAKKNKKICETLKCVRCTAPLWPRCAHTQ